MDFAPYQSSPPETQRQLSPPSSSVTASPRQSVDNHVGRRSFSPIQRLTPPPLQHPQPQRQWGAAAAAQNLPLPTSFASFGDGGGGACGSDSGLVGGVGGYRDGVSEFDTSFGIRLDYEACLAYLAVPPLGAIFLLILERKSDYVRFHAWQSSLLFTALFVLHLIFSWSGFLSWLIFAGDLVLIVWLTYRAYQDADTLDRYEVPVFGAVASRILDDE